MRYGSVCSGIEAATVAWHSLGWEAAWFSEIENFPSAVLAHHYPAVPNYGDMTKFEEWPNEPIDLLVGGTPCQSFSVAGLRKGLDDPRGNLMLTYGAIARRYRPRWLVWENVPGVLSSNGGRDFGTFLGMLAECGYGFAYRILDAQYFGVAQRRRRVFVVGYLGDWRRAAAVLFESESLRRDTAPSREKREETAPHTEGSVNGSWWNGEQIAATLTKQNAGGNQRMPDKQNFNAVVTGAITAAFGRNVLGAPEVDAGLILPVAQPAAISGDISHTLVAPKGGICSEDGTGRCPPTIAVAMQVRRLTPVECERLQGFPDGYTNIPWRKAAESPDGPRYKALGNSMAVPVMRWIGERIKAVDNLSW